jgi:adenylate cyclase
MAGLRSFFQELRHRTSPPDERGPNRFAEEILARHKQEGLDLAIKARWAALAVVAIMLPFLNPTWSVIYYHVLLALLALNGWIARRVGRVGLSRMELLVLFVDLLLLTIALAVPNPFGPLDWPAAMSYEFGNFVYFFIILAGATLAYSWRTIIAVGNWTLALWLTTAVLIWLFGSQMPDLTEAAQTAFAGDPALAQRFDPNRIDFDIRIQEVVVFMLVAFTLALTVRRYNALLLSSVTLERERANLSRYFSPNVVEELSNNDDPLKQIRMQDVAVLFVDIVGFTKLVSDEDPQKVIDLLRGFHQRMETQVFAHSGTLDKYLGDGLMATFGTPVAGPKDAINALCCARSMMDSVDNWNAERALAGEPEIRASFGVHYGPVVLGDIGQNRLEFAVVGNTVNVASRLEKLTREVGARIAVSAPARDQALRETAPGDPVLAAYANAGQRSIRGLSAPIDIWTVS